MQPTAVVGLSTSLYSVPAWGADMLDAGAIVCMHVHWRALMLELLFGHLSVSVPAGTECSDAGAVVWACAVLCLLLFGHVSALLMQEQCALMLELCSVVWACACMGC